MVCKLLVLLFEKSAVIGELGCKLLVLLLLEKSVDIVKSLLGCKLLALLLMLFSLELLLFVGLEGEEGLRGNEEGLGVKAEGEESLEEGWIEEEEWVEEEGRGEGGEEG